MSARRRFALALIAALALLAPAAAHADQQIGRGKNLAIGPGELKAAAGLALSAKEGGDIYVTDPSESNRVSQFDPSKPPSEQFVRAFGWGVVPGAAAGTGNVVNGSASIANVTTASGAFLVGQVLAAPGLPAGDLIENVNSNEIVLTQPATASAPGASLSVAAGPGNVPTDELQKLTVAATAGEFKLSFKSPNPGPTTATTAALSFEATPAEVQSALEGLANLGPGAVSVTGGPGDEGGTHPYSVEFQGRYADVNVHQLSAAAVGLSGGHPSSAATVATARQGAAALETCTTACIGEGQVFDDQFESHDESQPGQLRRAREIAVDNDPASPSYGDVYVVDQNNFRVQKYSPSGEFLLMFGGEVDKTTHANLCTKADLEAGDQCGAGVPGTGPAHFYQENPPTGGGGSFANLTWFETGNNSIAVGPDGTVYVGDYGRIQEFDGEGAFEGEFVLPLEGGEAQFVSALALDSTGDLYERSTTYYRDGSSPTQVPGIREFGPGPAHAFVRTFDAESGTEPTHVALDSAGDLIASDSGNGEFLFQGCGFNPSICPEAIFRAFKPAGALYAEFTSDQVQLSFENENVPGGVAVAGDASGTLYATSRLGDGIAGSHVAVHPLPLPGPPIVSAERLTDIRHTTATLHALVNPKQFDTESRFQYISQKKYEEDGSSFGVGTEQTALVPLGSVDRRDPVVAPISALTQGTVYHYRAVAVSTRGGGETVDGPDETFETLPPVSIDEFSTQTVAPELVELKALLNANGSGNATSYTIRYGTDASYTCEPGNACTSSGTLPAHAESPEEVTATFTGLKPNTTYHYKLSAENESGKVETADAVFTTELSAAEERAAEDCPLNGTVHGAAGGSTLREQNNSLALPDCRAYEQVSPAEKGGYSVFTNSLAPGGERDTFQSLGPIAGVDVGKINYYTAHRTPSGWLTQPSIARAGGPAYQPKPLEEQTAELDTSLFPVVPAATATDAEETTSPNRYYLRRPDGSLLAASPLLAPLGGAGVSANGWDGVIAESADLSRLFLLTSFPLLSEDPLPASEEGDKNRIYEVSGAGGPDPALRLLAEVSSGLRGFEGEATCNLDSSFGQRANSSSADGSVLFYDAPLQQSPSARCEGSVNQRTQPNKIALFACDTEAGPCVENLAGYHAPLQLSAESPTQCSSGNPCHGAPPANAHLDGASPDGSLAWFTTAQPLVDSDADPTESVAANDLYLAKLENGALTDLVQASAGSAAAGDPHPGVGAGVQGVLGVSQDGTHAAFVATGVLTTEPSTAGYPAEAHQTAAQGADNLYVYDAASGQTRFVARLCSGPERSGSLTDPACPKDLSTETQPGARDDARLWQSGSGRQAQLTPDGRFLLFASFGRLAPDDTDSARDVYRYDLQTGRLIRLSFGHRGNDANGNDGAYDAEIGLTGQTTEKLDEAAEDTSRSMSADGSTAIFITPAPLVSRDTNTGANPGCRVNHSQNANILPTGCDVYEWEAQGHGSCAEAGGCVSLLSDGHDPHGIKAALIGGPSGRDVTFTTTQGFAPADTDGVPDVYDARVEGGFPYTPTEIPCGGAEACHEKGTEQSLLPSFGTEQFVGPGNEPTQLKCAKGKVKVKKHGQVRCVAKKHHKAKKHHRRHHKRAARANRGGAK